MWDDKKEYNFSPLSIPKSNVNVDLGGAYRIYRKNGEMVEVQANSAAEAVEKSSISDAVKIVSMKVVRQQMMSKNILSPLNEEVETNIDIADDAPTGLGFLFVKDEDILKTEEKPDFEEFGLGSLAALGLTDIDSESAKPIKDEPVNLQENKVEEVISNKVEDDISDNTQHENEADDTDTTEGKELSTQEVRELLSPDDS